MIEKLVNDMVEENINKIVRHFKQLCELTCNIEGLIMKVKCPDIQRCEELYDILKSYPYNMRIQSVDGDSIMLDPQAVNQLIEVINNKLTGQGNLLKNINTYMYDLSNLVLTKKIPKDAEVFYELQFNEQHDEEYIKQFLDKLREFGVNKSSEKKGVVVITKFDIGRVDAACHKKMVDNQAYQRLRALDSAIKDIADQDTILSQLSKSFVMLLSSSAISHDGGKVVIENFFGHEELFRIFKQIQEEKNKVAFLNVS